MADADAITSMLKIVAENGILGLGWVMYWLSQKQAREDQQANLKVLMDMRIVMEKLLMGLQK